jgi:hypothetical protein
LIQSVYNTIERKGEHECENHDQNFWGFTHAKYVENSFDSGYRTRRNKNGAGMLNLQILGLIIPHNNLHRKTLLDPIEKGNLHGFYS